MYLRARLDTCAGVNIMPASVYHLIFTDPEMKKITPCKMQIGTYIADTLKIVGSCTFYIVHPDSKKVIPVTFYVATNDGSVLLSCKTTLALHLIQPRSRLDYLPPRTSLITSTMDSSKENKTSIFESRQLQTRSVHSNTRNARSSYNISVYKYSVETRYEHIIHK